MGNDENEARLLARSKLLEKTRNEKREQLIKEKRNIQSTEAEQPQKQLEELEEPLFRVVDLECDQEENMLGSNTNDYMYFLAKVQGKHLVDPFNCDENVLYVSDSDSDNPYEKDS